jgi:hypothetical protein
MNTHPAARSAGRPTRQRSFADLQSVSMLVQLRSSRIEVETSAAVSEPDDDRDLTQATFARAAPLKVRAELAVTASEFSQLQDLPPPKRPISQKILRRRTTDRRALRQRGSVDEQP